MHDAIALFLLPFRQNSYLQMRIIDERQYIDLQGDRRTVAGCSLQMYNRDGVSKSRLSRQPDA
jgi:hypothetical protein